MGQAKLEQTRDILQETAQALHSVSSVLQCWILEGRRDLKGINTLCTDTASEAGRRSSGLFSTHISMYLHGNELFWEKGVMVDVLEKNIAQTNHTDLRHLCKLTKD